MKVGRGVFSAAEGFIDRVLCVAGAVIFSQAPEFMQQYLQRLGGHVDEARRQLRQFESVARQSSLTLEQLVHQTQTNTDPAVAKLGAVMTAAVTREEHLASAQDALLHASWLSRPFVFLRHFDADIAHATWAVFKPAVPTTFEGLVYAVAGMLVFVGLYHGGIKLPIVRIRRRVAAAKTRPAPVV